MPILTLKDALTFLSLGGAAAAIQVVFSILLEKTKWFQALSDATRLTIMLCSAAALGLTSTLILNLTPPETLLLLQPYFLSVVASVSPLIGGEFAHRILKKAPVTQTTVTSLEPRSTVTVVSSDTLQEVQTEPVEDSQPVPGDN